MGVGVTTCRFFVNAQYTSGKIGFNGDPKNYY